MRFCVVTEKNLVLVEKMSLQTSIEYPYYYGKIFLLINAHVSSDG